MNCEEKDIKLIYENVGLQMPIAEVKVKCIPNRFVREDDFIKLFAKNLRSDMGNKYIIRNDFLCPFCIQSHFIKKLKEDYEITLINKIIQKLNEPKPYFEAGNKGANSKSKIYPEDRRKILFHNHEVEETQKDFEASLIQELRRNLTNATEKVENTCSKCLDTIPDSEIQKHFPFLKTIPKPIKNEEFIEFHGHIILMVKETFKAILMEHLLKKTILTNLKNFEYFCLLCSNQLPEIYLRDKFYLELSKVKEIISNQKIKKDNLLIDQQKANALANKNNFRNNKEVEKGPEIKNEIIPEDKKEKAKLPKVDESLNKVKLDPKILNEKKQGELNHQNTNANKMNIVNPNIAETKKEEKKVLFNKVNPTNLINPQIQKKDGKYVEEKKNVHNKINPGNPLNAQIQNMSEKKLEEKKIFPNNVNPAKPLNVHMEKNIGQPKEEKKIAQLPQEVKKLIIEKKVIEKQQNLMHALPNNANNKNVVQGGANKAPIINQKLNNNDSKGSKGKIINKNK